MTRHVANAETIQARWITSSYSGGGNDCVQAAALPAAGARAVRDSKRPAGPALLFSERSWTAFLGSARS
jgi:hypothetical protein